MEIRTARIAVTTTGSNGSASGSAVSESLHGFLLDTHVNYHASAPGSTTVTIASTLPAVGNLLVLSGANTDALYAPRQTVHTTAGAVTDPDGYDRIPLNGTLTASVGASNALTDAVIVTIRYLGL